MRFKMVGNKRDVSAVVVSNADTVTIPRGSPICLNVNGTDDGLAVVLPSGSAAKSHAFFYGVALYDIEATPTNSKTSPFGECQVFGFNNYSLFLLGTRAASTDSWTSTASVALGVLLNVDTINNAFSSSGGTLAKTAFLPFAVLGQSIASVAASASATSDTRTANTTAVKTFLRAL